MQSLFRISYITIYLCSCTSPITLSQNPAASTSTNTQSTHSHLSPSFSEVTLKTISIPQKLLRAISDEGMIIDADFLSKESLLLLTAKRAWIYKFRQKLTQKISLTASPQYLTIFHPESYALTYPSHVNMVLIKPNRKRIRTLELASENIQKVGLLSDQPVILTDKYLRIFQKQHNLTQTLNVPNPPIALSEQNVVIKDDHIWIFSSKSLWKWHPQISSQPTQSPTLWKMVIQNFRGIQNIAIHHKQVIIHTPHAIIVSTQNGHIEYTIPVSNNRKLAHFHLTADKHYYIFDDGQIEIYDTQNQSYHFAHWNNKNARDTNPIPDQIKFHESLMLALREGSISLHHWDFKPRAHIPSPAAY